ncbi:hemerythrin [Paenibacillus anaericanus]|uniref:bacteriohemerythrin n=1 Tax=Paenibacillus anaericanus TaxID=170367 RepID=UPI0027874B1E|nr:hemerythrin family protein [Paenibacillus anaericanus]MDQ0086721.1 hemerythrin [Paenibacillus anaericanus]
MMWKDKYTLGVDLIDKQHMELFERVESFLLVLRSKEPWELKVEKVKETLEFMKEYVVKHFHDEECYQRKVGYPDCNRHCEIHAEFTSEVQEFVKLFEEQGYEESLVQKFAGKLVAWLINHVAATDQKIADYIHRLEVEA